MSPHTDAGALLPCPFCGGEAVNKSYRSCDCCGKAYNGQIGCARCEAIVSHHDTDEDAIEAWNTRQAASHGREGGERSEVQIDDPNMCPNCFGDGYFPKEDLTGDDKCETCNGTGSRIPAVAQARPTPLAWICTSKSESFVTQDQDAVRAFMDRGDGWTVTPLYMRSSLPSASRRTEA